MRNTSILIWSRIIRQSLSNADIFKIEGSVLCHSQRWETKSTPSAIEAHNNHLMHHQTQLVDISRYEMAMLGEEIECFQGTTLKRSHVRCKFIQKEKMLRAARTRKMRAKGEKGQ